MATEVKLPPLAEKLEGGDVLDVKVAVGDTVSEGQTLLEVEAEKSTVEVPAPLAGRISQLQVKKGDHIKVGQTVCLIEAGAPAEPKAEKKPKAEKTEKTEPKPEKAEKAEEAESRKPKAESRPESREPSRKPKAEALPTAAAAHRLVPAGPATRRLARELGVDLALVTGSAAGGRVTQEDVKAFVRQLATGAVSGRAGGPVAAPALPDFERWGPVERKPLEGVRRRTAEQMSLAWSQIPHVTQHDEADITELDAFRKTQAENGLKLTVTAFALKAVAIALKQMPQFNASIDVAGNQMIFKQYIHVGVAVDTERGLLVPVIRDVDQKSVHELAEELTDLAERTRQKKLGADDMRGGTFTITNLGGIGGTAFTPIVNWPEVAILGLSRGKLTPVWRKDRAEPRLILPLSLSYDHRAIDGADAARFLRRLVQMLENPLQMVLYA